MFSEPYHHCIRDQIYSMLSALCDFEMDDSARERVLRGLNAQIEHELDDMVIQKREKA